ncbi:uncharacterized protein [Gossypium hirsutum]|uniref:Tf2-1-like SH3-like domain-containing protein n=1 Tax=Gossypium hirsutum TaxID=3635 RepID=A0ABM3BGZ3_GOSHI|nr:uncharacterized protein LOC121226491 [Gossypium hirsutum]
MVWVVVRGHQAQVPIILRRGSQLWFMLHDAERTEMPQMLLRKKVLRFGRKGKLSSRFIEPYHILKCVGPVAYQLELPLELERIHDVFHVSILRSYRSDPTYIISTEEVEFRPNLTFEEEPVQILDHSVNVLRKKFVPLVKVLWRNHSSDEPTWELEESMRQ